MMGPKGGPFLVRPVLPAGFVSPSQRGEERSTARLELQWKANTGSGQGRRHREGGRGACFRGVRDVAPGVSGRGAW